MPNLKALVCAILHLDAKTFAPVSSKYIALFTARSIAPTTGSRAFVVHSKGSPAYRDVFASRRLSIGNAYPPAGALCCNLTTRKASHDR